MTAAARVLFSLLLLFHRTHKHTQQKQRKPTSVQKGVGAILGEAADVVGARGGSAGSGSSPYLNRLSEIQIQDEAYIHQQLVKPEEGGCRTGQQAGGIECCWLDGVTVGQHNLPSCCCDY